MLRLPGLLGIVAKMDWHLKSVLEFWDHAGSAGFHWELFGRLAGPPGTVIAGLEWDLWQFDK